MNRLPILFLLVLAACASEPAGPSGTPGVDTIYRSASTSPDAPEWAKDAVWYQIFPERFRNGDPANDPTAQVVESAWPFHRVEGWKITPWTGDWYEQSDWERSTGRPFYGTVTMRRYGGDLAGMIEALPYLDSLGVTALYLNPMFDAPSLHKYDGSTFHHIDVHFGPDPVGDREIIASEVPSDPSTWRWTRADRLFLEFVEQAHARDMRVILDGVFNHMGMQSFVMRDLQANQQASAYAEWVDVTSWDDPATPDTSEFDWRGWAGVKDLPELAENEAGLIPPVRDYVFASVTRWMDPNGDGDPSDGIDGWRLDVAEMVDLDFWRIFRTFIRTINPDAYTTGEVWWDDWRNNKMMNAAPWLQGDAFDAVMNYRWATAARRLFIGSDLEAGETYGPTRFFDELAALRADYPAEANFVLMNTLGSHDTDRPASQVVNPAVVFDHGAGAKDNPEYDMRRPNAAEWNTLRLMLAHQFTYVGAPHLFYGDEAGMWGGDDPDERKPMVWPARVYDDEATHPHGAERTPDPVSFDRDLYRHYQTLISLRRGHAALSRGSFEPLVADDANGILVYRRTLGRDRVWVAFNLTGDRAELRFDASPVTDRGEQAQPAASLMDLLGGPDAVITDSFAGTYLEARSAAVFVAR